MKAGWRWIPIALGILTLGSYGLFVYLQPPALPQGIVYGNGRVEATEVRISSEVGGRVAESKLVEGVAVRRGDLLVQIDETDLKLRLAQTEAEQIAARRERERVEAELQIARHHLETAENGVRRHRILQARNTVSVQRLEQAENAFRGAQGIDGN